MRKNGASPDARGRRAAVRASGPQIRRARAQLVSTYNYRARSILVVVITGSRTLRGHDCGTSTTARRIPSFVQIPIAPLRSSKRFGAILHVAQQEGRARGPSPVAVERPIVAVPVRVCV